MAVVRPLGLLVVVGIAGLLSLTSCGGDDVESEGTYFDKKIAPILQGSCATSPTASKCHVTSDEKRGFAMGNLDVSSYEMLSKRADLFAQYGPYGMPALLVKAVPSQTLELFAYDGSKETVTTDLPHAGGSILDPSSAGFQTILKWIERGHTKNNTTPAKPELDLDPCLDKWGKDPLFDPANDPPNADYQQFKDNVNPWLVQNCSAGNCHGSLEISFPVSCGNTPEQVRWNYFNASDYVAKLPEQSEILRRSLAPAYGGTYHVGGAFLGSPEDAQYKKILDWATAHGPPTNIPKDPGFDMFAKRVQPMLVKKGCILLGCHSPPGFNLFRPRAPSGGQFGLAGSRHNYEAVLEFVALESPNPNTSRLIAKNLVPDEGGILHRGGALLAKGGDPAKCDLGAAETGPLDDQDPYCVMVAWIAKERAERMKSLPALSAVVYVKRPFVTDPDRFQDFEKYRPGADLRWVGAQLDAQGALTTTGGDKSLLAGCGLTAATADVRRPQVGWDGSEIVFSARSAATEPFKIYRMKADGAGCTPEPLVNDPPTDTAGTPLDTKGELIHNFDPALAPDGTLVFASTRGHILAGHPFAGPRRSAADPGKQNANLYLVENGKIRQLTFLSNQELMPSFEINGQVLMTTEKRAPGFYQLASRRINIDGGDYHPNFGQRSTFGYRQLIGTIQLANANFVGIASHEKASQQAGALIVMNRSMGPDNVSTDAKDYLEEPDAIEYAKSPFFQHSVSNPDPAATGQVATQGAYRDVSGLPNSNVLVSYAANVVTLDNFSGNFDVVVVDPMTGQRSPVAGLNDATADEIWPVAVYGRVSRGVYRSTKADAVMHSYVYTDADGPNRTDRFELTFVDFPMVASLLFQSARGIRKVEDMDSFEAWASLPPENDAAKDGPYMTEDEFGPLYARRLKVGAVPLLSDGSVRVQAPAGLPVVLAFKSQFQGEPAPTLHHQREELQFYPGEWLTLSMRRESFGGFCGGCHGPRTGKETDVSVKPDIISTSSASLAKKSAPIDATKLPANPEIKGPPFP